MSSVFQLSLPLSRSQTGLYKSLHKATSEQCFSWSFTAAIKMNVSIYTNTSTGAALIEISPIESTAPQLGKYFYINVECSVKDLGSANLQTNLAGFHLHLLFGL